MSTVEDWIARDPELGKQLHAAEERWTDYFIRLALVNASMSKDPDTRVGAVVVGPDREVRSSGFNGLPRGIQDRSDRINIRDNKLQLIVHAEMNCLMSAARVGVSMRGCTLYLACTDDTSYVWGGPPCIRCSMHVIQAGITKVVSPPQKAVSKWKDDLDQAKLLLAEAGVTYQET